MTHTIRVDDQVYDGLRAIQAPRESYSDVICRLLDLRRMITGLEPILRGSHAYHAWRAQRDAEKKMLERHGDRSALSDLQVGKVEP